MRDEVDSLSRRVSDINEKMYEYEKNKVDILFIYILIVLKPLNQTPSNNIYTTYKTHHIVSYSKANYFYEIAETKGIT